jgi:hypothetical protein
LDRGLVQELFPYVLVKGVHLSDRKKNAAFAQWGEHPIPDAGRQIHYPPFLSAIFHKYFAQIKGCHPPPF